jgi:hypothetical protein
MSLGTMKLLVAVQQMVNATAPEENNYRTPTALGPQLEDPPRAATAWAATTTAGVAAVAAHHTVIMEAEATQTTM